MNIAPRIPKPKPCAFCTFKASPWSTSTSLLRWQDGSIRHRHGGRERKRHKKLESGLPSASPWVPLQRVEPNTRSPLADQETRIEPGIPRRPRRGERRPSAPSQLPASSGQYHPGLFSGGKGKESAYEILGNVVYEQALRFMDREKRLVTARIADASERVQQVTLAALQRKLAAFKEDIRASAARASRLRNATVVDNPLFFHFRQAFISGHIPGLLAEIKYRYLQSVHGKTSHSSKATAELQAALADLSHPQEWYPGTRAMQRTVHLHIGPTNSGKTYHALKKLEAAKTGVYAGPLRLLAHEVYTRFNAMGKKCALITGEEQRVPEGMKHTLSSCTVEMVPLNTEVDVAVIDEIQMIGDFSRGWAWTQAFLGVQAKEVHLCGEERTEELITSLCRTIGDKLIIHRYKRLGLLDVEPKSLQSGLSFTSALRNLQKGDAVILFSRVAIHAMKKSIEKATGKRCAVVYGSLPPETRAQQAALFNDPNNDYDYLAASNAVGMGLNLSIKRIIFEGTTRFNGVAHTRLDTSEIKQIAGRAGRFKSSHDAIVGGKATIDGANPALPSKPEAPPTGFVTSFHKHDLNILTHAMKKTVPQIKTAGIFPPDHITAKFASFFSPNTPFSYVMLRLKELLKTDSRFHACDVREIIDVLDVIQPYKMTVKDRLTFVNAPVQLQDPGALNFVTELASCISNQNSGELLDIRSLNLGLLDLEVSSDPSAALTYLRNAEVLHKNLTLYLWLSYRFPAIFRSQALAFHVKGLIEEKIDVCLSQVGGHITTRVSSKKIKRMDEQFERVKQLEESGILEESNEEDQLDLVDALESIDGLEIASEDSAEISNGSWAHNKQLRDDIGDIKRERNPLLIDSDNMTPATSKIEAEA
ncbi:hypothetical protein HYALB_00002631 [Hymenoscyphus albidus]|uniref:RNA helicase n=1 Tax=Hymenoscyphus albidus TaxID=595503 RepID=A0A9N9PYV7_9HELO|nr:hypothetical protein HYALB_00002631 [Hymenoscyphus albidus]